MNRGLPRQETQRKYWNGRYGEDPALFGGRESAFARWSLRWIAREAPRGRLLELGAGYGRDLRFFQGRGLKAKGVDCADRAVASVRGAISTLGAPPVDIDCAEVFDFLKEQKDGSVDIVYSNLFWNMDFTRREHLLLFGHAARILRDGGLHLYSVRSVRDPWYGKGRRVREDTYDLTPDGTTMHFFSPLYAESLHSRNFEGLALQEAREGADEFPIRLLYVADRKLPPGGPKGRKS